MSEQLPLTPDLEARVREAHDLDDHEAPPQYSPGAERDFKTGERFTPDCNGPPGLCLFMRCRWNLILEVLPKTGTITVTDPDGGFTTLPLHKDNQHVIGPDDVEEAGERAAWAAEWLEAQYGTTCVWDIVKGGELTQGQVANVLRLTRQRVTQVERGMKRNAKLRGLAADAKEQRGRRRETVWPEPAPRLYAIRKKP